MSVEFNRESPGKFDSRTLSRETLSRWTGRRYLFSRCRVGSAAACGGGAKIVERQVGYSRSPNRGSAFRRAGSGRILSIYGLEFSCPWGMPWKV